MYPAFHRIAQNVPLVRNWIGDEWLFFIAAKLTAVRFSFGSSNHNDPHSQRRPHRASICISEILDPLGSH